MSITQNTVDKVPGTWAIGWRVALRMTVYHICFLVFGSFAILYSGAYEYSQVVDDSGVATQAPAATALYVLTAFFIIIYLYLAYQTVWPWGQRDFNRVKHGRSQYNALKGFWIGCVASIPGLVLVLLAWATMGISSISFWSKLLLGGYYIPFYCLNALSIHPLIYLLALPWLPLTAQLAFRFGYRSYSPLQALVFKKKSN